MAKHRYSEILSDESITTAGTKIIDLNLTDPITALMFQVRLTGAASAATGHPVAAIKKVEVIDGSDVLVSLTGAEAQAKHFFDFVKPPVNLMAYASGVQAVASFIVPFGKFLWDEELGFDPGKFNNPQIRVQHNYALGGASPDAATLQVYALCFDANPPALKGFVESKEMYSYTVTAGAYEYIELPRDYPIRRVIIQALAADKAPYQIYNEIKLSEDHDKKVLVDESTSNLIKMLMAGQAPYVENIFACTDSSGVDIYVTPSQEVHAAVMAMSTAAYLAKEETPGHVFKVIGSGATNYRGVISGLCPHGALDINFGDPYYQGDAWDVIGLKSAQLRIKAGSSPGTGTTCQVVTEQYRSY
jgi:hypothetical protein